MRKNSFRVFAKLFAFSFLILSSCAPKKIISPTEKIYSQRDVDEILKQAEIQLHNQQQVIELLRAKLESIGLIDTEGRLKTAADRKPEKPVTGREKWQK